MDQRNSGLKAAQGAMREMLSGRLADPPVERELMSRQDLEMPERALLDRRCSRLRRRGIFEKRSRKVRW